MGLATLEWHGGPPANISMLADEKGVNFKKAITLETNCDRPLFTEGSAVLADQRLLMTNVGYTAGVVVILIPPTALKTLLDSFHFDVVNRQTGSLIVPDRNSFATLNIFRFVARTDMARGLRVRKP
jgi:hypothetical protein